MDIKVQVCGIEMAVQLSKLGVKYPSIWKWVHPFLSSGGIDKEKWDVSLGVQGDEYYNAYTVAEFGEVLKIYLKTEVFPEHYVKPFEDAWVYRKPKFQCSKDDNNMFGCANTEANARAEYLIYLIKKGLVAVDKKGYIVLPY